MPRPPSSIDIVTYPWGMSLRRTVASLSLLIPAVALAGCAPGPQTTTPQAPAPSTSSKEPSPAPEPSAPAEGMRADAAWLDAGRVIGVVTWGSSSCVPFAEDPAASGQEVSVTLTDPEGRPCTKDLVARASVVGVPAGVNPKEDVTLKVSYLGQESSFELDGDDDLTGTPGDPTDYAPSAGWFDDDKGIVLLTWGSSSCPPVVEKVDDAADAITVSFTTTKGACTADVGPRATVISVANGGDDDRQLVLVGDNLDAKVKILG